MQIKLWKKVSLRIYLTYSNLSYQMDQDSPTYFSIALISYLKQKLCQNNLFEYD